MLAETFNGIIDLPKSQYFFSGRTTFWQIFFNLLSIIFTSIDTAIDDIIGKVAHSISKNIEKVGIFLTGRLVPKMVYA